MAALLLLETTTEVCSIGIARNGQVLALEESKEPNQHSTQITLLIEKAAATAAIKLSDIAAIALSAGPGSYTALRVGAATAKGICYALDKPLIAVDTLAALASATWKQLNREALYFPMIDARRMEVYTAGFLNGQERLSNPEAMVITPESFSAWTQAGHHIVLSGNGAAKCKMALNSDCFTFSPLVCSALHLISWAEKAWEEQAFEDVAYFNPFYLKPPNITKSKKLL
ncbi:MAG TPA: tRNA (adenosine(37)-N6)-threonylcarbamoyltransferase complex dimerization subunit type 1 TsaB [Saprospiraceae bacterium]|nr:tRNA (adenosine(37)-N6)-threonylcarbamoyltransferase complex dimerization subunit type 1 TsaB [Saprospiraceae bacterium]HMQ82528.1 tRNA (adenosine(37)-N6)-threonylcarbamoyltransferase complex dimerization subunit type 1 TsaB [Saprospiraceae bacterium]